MMKAKIHQAIAERMRAKTKAAQPELEGEGEPAKFVLRLPKSLHARLVARAASEGVSLNTMITAFLAEGLGRRA
jgi:predicted HicB family RNase H-like nuclease